MHQPHRTVEACHSQQESDMSQSAITLRPGVAHRLVLPHACVIEVLSGCLWVTFEGEWTDWFVKAGQHLVVQGHGVVVESEKGQPAHFFCRPMACATIRPILSA